MSTLLATSGRVLSVKTWRDHWRPLLGWALGLAAISAMQLAVYPSVRESSAGMNELIDSFPSAFKTMFRMTDYTSGPGYLGAEMFSVMVPFVFVGLGASWGAGATATEEERGTADLLLTLPVTRDRVLLAKLAALLSALAGLALLLWAILLVGARAVDLSIGTGQLLGACAAVALLGCLYAGVGLLAGALTGHRGVALGAAIGAALAAFLLYSLGPLVDALEPWLKVTPFQWALGNSPLRNGISLGYAGLLAGVSVALFGAAVLAFRRRDIGT
jgi:ABC-2 type transport system permease protein